MYNIVCSFILIPKPSLKMDHINIYILKYQQQQKNLHTDGERKRDRDKKNT